MQEKKEIGTKRKCTSVEVNREQSKIGHNLYILFKKRFVSSKIVHDFKQKQQLFPTRYLSCKIFLKNTSLNIWSESTGYLRASRQLMWNEVSKYIQVKGVVKCKSKF